MLTDREYRLLMKIHKRKVTRVEDLWPWEINTFRELYKKGCVELDTENREQQLEYGEVVLDENTGGEADKTKYGVKPKLEPGPSRIFTPAFIRKGFRSLIFGFLLSFGLCFFLKLFFMGL